MNPLVKKILAILFFFLSFIINVANAELGGGASRLTNMAPAGIMFPTEGPIVFPDFAMAAGTNASAMTNERGTAFQLGGSPSNNPIGFFGGFTRSTTTSGFGLGYLGSMASSGTITHSAFAGYAYKIKNVSLGVALRDLNVQSGAVNIDLSGTVQAGNLRIAAILYHLDFATQLGIGIGMKHGKSFTAELNAITPTLNNLAGNYTLTGSATMNFGPVGFIMRASYYTTWSTYSWTVGGLVWAGDHFNVIAQYTSNQNLTFALTLSF